MAHNGGIRPLVVVAVGKEFFMSGWNGSQSSGAANHPQSAQKRRDKSPSPLRGLVCGGLVVVGATLAAWWLLRTSDYTPAANDKPQSSRAISEVTPAAAPKPKEVRPSNAESLRKRFPGLKIPDDWEKPYPPQAYWPDGRLKQHSRYVKVITNKVNWASLSVEERTFKNHAERDIAGALLIEPGEELVGDYEYGEWFTESFLESLKHPMVEDKDDTPFQKELRRAVEETKKELKKRYDEGEDLAAIMNETRKQMKELALYREEVRSMVEDVREKSGGELTEQDEKDLIDAANKMLEDRGCKPLELPHAFLEKIELENKGYEQ